MTTCAEPTQVVAGDTIAWDRAVARYAPSDGWTLKYRLVGGSVDVTVSDTGADGTFHLAIAADKTADVVCELEAQLIGWVEKGAEKHTIFSGTVRLLPNVRIATATDLMGHVQRVLAAIECRLEGRVSTDVARYGREGVFVDKLPIADLLRIQGIYKSKRWQEQNPGSAAPINVIRFSSPGGGNAAERLAWPGADP